MGRSDVKLDLCSKIENGRLRVDQGVIAGCYVRQNVIVGDGCVLGNSSEFKNCLLLDGVQAAHFNYVGDSLLGNGAVAEAAGQGAAHGLLLIEPDHYAQLLEVIGLDAADDLMAAMGQRLDSAANGAVTARFGDEVPTP